ncbi:MAG: hypothetical protein AAGA20_14280 [Planctomycetota bacterium]
MPACTSTSDEPVLIEEDPKDQLRGQLVEADRSFDGRAYGEALSRYQAIHLAAQSRAHEGVAVEAAAQVATIHALQGELDQSDQWMSRAENVDDDAEGAWSRILLARGIRSWKRGDTAGARGTFIELYNYCQLHDREARAVQAANLAALVSLGEEQLDWSLRAIQAAQDAGEAKWEAQLWASHGWLLDDRGRYPDALRAFERARELELQTGASPITRVKADWAYAHGMRMMGRLDESRALLDRINSVTHSMHVAKPTPRTAEWLGRTLWEIGEIDATEGRDDRARERFLAAREKLVEAGATESAPQLVEEIDDRIRALDAPESLRKIPPRRRDDSG